MREFNQWKRRRWFIHVLSAHANKWILLCIVGGLLHALFLMYPHPLVHQKVFCSENALLPNQVITEYSYQDFAYVLNKLNEVQALTLDNRTQWLVSELTQLGFVPHLHRSTRCGLSKDAFCTTVYARLHAPRGDGTDTLVLSASWVNEVTGKDNLVGVLTTLSIAKFWRKYAYWSKDILFLIPSDLQSGEAWIHDYFLSTSSPTLHHAGDLHAALHLDLPELHPNRFVLKFMGDYGQVPNLDYIALLRSVANGFGIPLVTEDQGSMASVWTGPLFSWVSKPSMHRAFRRFGVHAVTLHGTEHPEFPKVASTAVSSMVESIFRSLNNLIERFHAGYFVYLLPTLSTFLPMPMYLPCLAWFALAWLISSMVHFQVAPSMTLSRWTAWVEVCSLLLTVCTTFVFIPSWCVPLGFVLSTWFSWKHPMPVQAVPWVYGLTRFNLALLLVAFALLHLPLALTLVGVVFPLDFLLPLLRPSHLSSPSFLLLFLFHPFWAWTSYLRFRLASVWFYALIFIYIPVYLSWVSLVAANRPANVVVPLPPPHPRVEEEKKEEKGNGNNEPLVVAGKE